MRTTSDFESGSRRLALRCLLALGLMTPAACSKNEYAPPPPPSVSALRPTVQDVVLYGEFTGTTRAVEAVEVRARVKGFLQSMEFSPGDMIERGELLFVIDPEPFEIALQAAKGERTAAKAQLDLSETEFRRTEALYKKKATSEMAFIKMRAQRDKAAAALATADAAVRSAELDLDYAHVKAPITGRVGRHLIDIGNLVGSDGATRLTEMVRYAPLYVYFHISERDVLALQSGREERRKQSGVDPDERPPTPIEVGRSNEEGYPHHGEIDFTALQIDPSTGTYEVRGVLPNEGDLDTIIVPGTFVRVRVPLDETKGALLIDERALGADQGGRYLLVVDDDELVELRRVEVGPSVGRERLIESGIGADDWVIVEGLQRARPGGKVDAKRGAVDAQPGTGA